ncbi:MAG: SpoIIE family protein phosphatase [Oscillospiraceae bacterium]
MLKNPMAAAFVRANKQVGILTEILVILAVSFLLANSTISEIQSPLIVAFLASVSLWNGIFVFAGALLAWLFSAKLSFAAIEIVAMIVVLLAKILLEEILSMKVKTSVKSAFAALSVLAAGVAVSMFSEMNTTVAFVVFSKAIFCGTATYFIAAFFSSFEREKKLVFSGEFGVILGAVFLLIIAAFSAVSIGFFNVGRALGIFAILVVARRFNHVGGAICGTLVACGAALFLPKYGMASMLLPMTGIIAGLCTGLGLLPMTFFFIAANAVGVILLGVTPETARILVEVIIAAIAFVAIPERVFTKIFGVILAKNSSDKAVEIASSKLKFAAKTIGEVQKNVEQISMALEKKVKSTDIVSTVCERVCGKCSGNLNCWERDFDTAFESFNFAKNQLIKKGKIVEYDLPQKLNSCIKKSALVEEFNRSFLNEISEKNAEEKLKEMREILYQQFGGMEDLLCEISAEISVEKTCDDRKSQEVSKLLETCGAASPRVLAYTDSFGRMMIEAFYSGEISLAPLEICDKISGITERDFELPEIFRAEDFSKLCIIEKPAYEIDFGAVQKAGGTEKSGDTFERFSDGKGNEYFIISDGMGSGKMAAVDSKMTSMLLSKLLKAGVGYSAAVKIVNSSMLVKSSYESFATLDIACINLYTGRLDLLKLGAAATFVKTNSKVVCVEFSTMPIGILGKISEEKRSVVLKNGDEILMISDGISEQIFPKIKEILLDKNNLSAKEISEKILAETCEKEEQKNADDVTILSIKINKKT